MPERKKELTEQQLSYICNKILRCKLLDQSRNSCFTFKSDCTPSLRAACLLACLEHRETKG